MTTKEALYRTIESLSEEEALRVTELIGKIHQNCLPSPAAAETGEAPLTSSHH
jgi:hypothetical protein